MCLARNRKSKQGTSTGVSPPPPPHPKCIDAWLNRKVLAKESTMSEKEETGTWVVYMESAKRECLGVGIQFGQVKGDVCPEDRVEKQLPLKWPGKSLLKEKGSIMRQVSQRFSWRCWAEGACVLRGEI